MISVRFPDRDTEKRALAFLLGRFSGRILRTGEHSVPQAAIEALADQSIPFTVLGSHEQPTAAKVSNEQPLAPIRNSASAAV